MERVDKLLAEWDEHGGRQISLDEFRKAFRRSNKGPVCDIGRISTATEHTKTGLLTLLTVIPGGRQLKK